MDELVAIQQDTISNIKKAVINFKKTPKVRLSTNYIKIRIETIDCHWNTFKKGHTEILKLLDEDSNKHRYFTEDMFSMGEEEFILAKSEMMEKLEELQEKITMNPQQLPQGPLKHQEVKLPKIDIPKFNGNYNDWTTFHDLYTSLIHNNISISGVQKLHYLKCSLTSEAEQLLKHIQITENNYEVAWNMLKQRYSNKRILVNTIFHRLLSQKKIYSMSVRGIKELLDTTVECLNNLKNQGIDITNWDPIIIHLIVAKLDQESHKIWEEELNQLSIETLPTLDKFTKFLEGRFRVLEMISANQVRDKIPIKSQSFMTSTSNSECTYCKEDHLIFNCKEFINLNPDQRSEFALKQHLCFNCLWPGHSVRYCRYNNNCRQCKRKHHTLLHSIKQGLGIPSNVDKEDKNNEEEVMVEEKILSHVSVQQKPLLLATALVNIQTDRGMELIRALIDPCSHESFISEATVRKLQLKRKPMVGNASGLAKTSTQFKQAVELEIFPRFDNNFKINCTAFVVKEVTDSMPSTKVASENWTEFQKLTLADPSYNTPGEIDMLLGIKIYTKIIMSGLIKIDSDMPIAQQTKLGWIISGGEPQPMQRCMNKGVSMHLKVTLDNMMQKFWDSEAVETETTKLTTLEIQAEDNYNKNVNRQEDGRYVVALPFVRNPPRVPENSREIAEKRLKSLERKLEKNEELRVEYNKVIREYLVLKHMEPVVEPRNQDIKPVYLPHHAVVREDKMTSRVRVVFDASCQGSNGVSLNSELLTGPSLQEELRDVILRWRKHKICFITDIVKMYRQIMIQKKDADFQRILWRFHPKEEIKEFRLLTVTFGTACAPYLAIKTLRQLVKDEGHKYPQASEIISKNCYMDDILSGCDDLENAIKLSKDLNEMLSKGKFQLQKWSSNCEQFMENIEPEKRASATEVEMNRNDSIKTLGITWEIKEDKLKMTQKSSNDLNRRAVTKREVLSLIASMFDPMGWFSPTVVVSKIFMQKLWMHKIEWDEYLPDNLAAEWYAYYSEIESLSEIKIDRWIGTEANSNSVELHGFSDASQVAYSAVIYSRVIQSNGEVVVSLLMSKTRVAPLKNVSLPRLELCGALLLSQLLKHVAEAMNIDMKNIYAWSDSKITLAWIAGDPSKWTPFVKNRVIDILNNLKTCWLYVNTKQNPADPASRGVMPNKLKNCDLWWKGPEFLHQPNIELPSENIPDTNVEKRITAINCVLIRPNLEDLEEKGQILKKYSTLRRLLNVMAYCRRWIKILRKEKILPNYITCIEREEALNVCIQIAQEIEFPAEIAILRSKKNIKRSSRLLPLNPYLDERGIIRVGGRLKHADMESVRKHPIIISKDNLLIPVLLDDAHQKTLHGGPQLMTSYLRNKYWIIKGGQTIKRFYRKCITCVKYNAQPKSQQMANLPEFRVKPSKPFLISGVDFAGPILCRLSKGRGTKAYKAYICLFICMVTRAIHLEIVSDMTTDAFMAAFKRFISRRGFCEELWSDHGTTFIAANKQLLQMWKQGNNELPVELKYLLGDTGTQWKYIPPGSPNFGGLWEAGVKSTKYHLKRIIGDSTLTFEELYTVLTQIEGCLNSRPLAPIGEDLDVLTPGHFLIGEPIVCIPDRSYEHSKVDSLTRWKLTQKMVQDFWKRWQSEYLSRLQERGKWRQIKKDLEIGELVLIKDSRTPPASWRLGRIQKKYPGDDNLTRMYDIHTASGLVQRSISRLCPLPS